MGIPRLDSNQRRSLYPGILALNHEGAIDLPTELLGILELSIGIEPINKSFADSSLANWVTERKIIC